MNYYDKILAYLKAGRRGKDANRLEREALNDPFLNDAVDGFATNDNNEQLLADISGLQQQIEQRSHKRPQHRRTLLWWAAASVTVFLIGSISYLVLRNSAPQSQLAVIQETKEEATPLPAEKQLEKEEAAASASNFNDYMKQAERKPEAAVAEPSLAHQAKIAEHEDLQNVATDIKDDASISESMVLAEKPKATTANEAKDVSVAEESEKGSDMVVVGYGVQKKKVAAANERVASSELMTDIAYSDKATKAENKMIAENVKELEPVTGWKTYNQYLKDSLVYPADAIAQKIEGKVLLFFHIDANGRPYNITVGQGLSISCNKEAIRLLEQGGNWKPSTATPPKLASMEIVFKLREK